MGEGGQEGGCLCGAVRYRVRGEPLLVEYCHCGMCRRAGGAPVVAWADFAVTRVEWIQGAATEYSSSPNGRRGFCRDCGSTLTFRWATGSEKISLSVGTLDHPDNLRPQHHIFEADRLSWLQIADNLPRHRKALPPKDTS